MIASKKKYGGLSYDDYIIGALLLYTVSNIFLLIYFILGRSDIIPLDFGIISCIETSLKY